MLLGRTPETLVMPWYYIAYPARGTSQAAFAQDIADAQAIGCDGFVLMYNRWIDPALTITKVTNMFAAAVGTTFKLALCPLANTIVDDNDVLTPYELFKDHANYWHDIDNRPIFCVWAAGSHNLAYWQALRVQMTKAPVWYMYYGFFLTAPQYTNPTIANMRTQWTSGGLTRDFIDGLMNYSSVGILSDSITGEETYIDFAREKNVLAIGGMKGSFWQGRTYNNPGGVRTYYEALGGDGMDQHWAMLRGKNLRVICPAIWHDPTEDTFTPAAVADRFPTGTNVDALQLPNEGAYWHLGYNIEYLKTGIQPAMNDAGYIFHRTHAADASIPADDTVPPNVLGSPADVIHVTTHCTAAAQLVYNNGASIDVASGVVHTDIAWETGSAQELKLNRDGVTIWTQNLVPIDAAPTVYNFNVASYYAHA